MGDGHPLAEYMAGLATSYGPAIASGLGSIGVGAGRAELKRQARRLIQAGKKMLGVNGTVSKFRPRQQRGLPRYRKGHERITGAYGRFKPSFGKELKFFDTSISNQFITTQWEPEFVSKIGKGTGPKVRLGRHLIIRSIQMRLRITKPAAFESAIARVLIVLDKQTNGEAYVGTQLMEGASLQTTTWAAYRNLNRSERFEILWDKTYTLNAYSNQTNVIPASTSINDTYYKKVNIPMILSGTADSDIAPITDIQTNNISVCVCCDQLNATTITYRFRIRFTG